MYCAKCGNELKEGENFCPKCGAKVGAKSMKTATLLGIIFALVVIIGLMVLNYRNIFKKFIVSEKKIEETIVSEEESVVETETTAPEETTISMTTQAIAQTTKAVVATQAPIATQAPVTTTQPLVVSFTPPISGTVAAETQMQQQTVVVETETSKRKGAADGGPVTEETANVGPGVYIAPTSAKSVVTDPEVVGNHIQEVKVKTTTKYTDSIEDDDNHTCKITIAKPNMQGKDQEETDALNSSIEELMDALIEDVESLVDDYDDLPKSISLTSVALTSTTRTNIFITISGSITPRSGSSKTLKYRITYDREEQIAEYNKV